MKYKHTLSTRKKWIIACIFGVLLSLFLALELHLVFTGYLIDVGSRGFFRDIRLCTHYYGFPWAGWILTMILLLVVSFTAYLSILRNRGVMDKLGRRFRMAKNKEDSGGAHFEAPDEYADIANITRIENASGTILGQLTEGGEKVIEWKTRGNRKNSHIMVFGASGTGKSYTFSNNYILQVAKRGESLIITDPDGGLQRQTRGFLESMGYKVRCLNLVNFDDSDGWDCMKSLAMGRLDETSQSFAHTVISNVTNEHTDRTFVNGPMSLLRALILRVYLGHDFPQQEKNIKTAYNLLMQPQSEKFLDNLFDESKLANDEKPCLKAWRAFLQTSPNLKGNLISDLSTNLQILQSETVSTLLSTDDIDLLAPGKEKCAYFCRFPDNSSTYDFVVSLFFSMLVQSLVNFADSQRNGRLPVPVNFLMDEFPSIGILPDWSRKMATIRKRNMNVAMVIQDITQLQHNYEDTWITIFSNCATWLAVGINDQETAALISRRIGKTTIETNQMQHDMFDRFVDLNLGIHPYRTNITGRDLLSIDELHEIDQDDSLIIVQGHNPIMAKKVPWVEHPFYEKAVYYEENSPLGPLPPLGDTAGRTEYRRREEAYLQKQRKKLGCKEKAYSELKVSRFTSVKQRIEDWMYEDSSSKKKGKAKKTSSKKSSKPQVKTKQAAPKATAKPKAPEVVKENVIVPVQPVPICSARKEKTLVPGSTEPTTPHTKASSPEPIVISTAKTLNDDDLDLLYEEKRVLKKVCDPFNG